MATTLTNLIARVRQRADQENSALCSDAEITTYIQEAQGELYDLLVGLNEDYYLTSQTVTVATGNTYALASLTTPLLKLRGVDLDNGGGQWITLRRYNFAERNQYQSQPLARVWNGPPRMYRLVGTNLAIEPETAGPGVYRIWYVPMLTQLTSGSDTVDALLDSTKWIKFLVIDAAIKCATKEESESTVAALKAEKKALIDGIQSAASDRDSGEAERVTDVNAIRGPFGVWGY